MKLACPEIIVGEKGDTFDCDASAGRTRRGVKVTQNDDKGNVRYELRQQ